MKNKTINLTDPTQSSSKTVLMLAWPVLLEQILTTLIGYADTAMVGSLGAWATAAVGINSPFINMINSSISALCVGITALVAQAVGAGEHDKVKELMRHALFLIVAVGIPAYIICIALYEKIPLWMGAGEDIVYYAAQYNLTTALGRIFLITSLILNSVFRGYGDTKTPLINNTVMNIVNLIFNFLLIYPSREISLFGYSFHVYGADMGIKGAAVATSIGMLVAGVLSIRKAFSKSNEYAVSIHDNIKPNKRVLKQIFTISLPACFERLTVSTASVIITSTVAYLGTVSIAAKSLVDTAESLSYMPAFAFQTAVTTLVGQAMGAGNIPLAEKFVSKTIVIGSVTMFFTGCGLFVFAEEIIGIFSPDTQVVALAAECLRVFALIQVPQVISWVFSGALRGAGDTRFGFYVNTFTNWTFRVLGSVIFVRVLGFELKAVIILCAVEILVGLGLFFLRYNSGKWKSIYTKNLM